MAGQLIRGQWDEGVVVNQNMWRFYGRVDDTIECRVDKFWRFLNKNESFKVDWPGGDCFIKFKEVTEYLRSKFEQIPNDEIQFFHEVSNLACGGVASKFEKGEERIYAKEFLKDYIKLYLGIIKKYQPMDGDVIIIKACKYLYDDIRCLQLIAFLLMSTNAKQLFLGLKLLKIALVDSAELRELGVDREWLLILHNLKLISPSKHKGITYRIIKLAKACFNKFNSPYDHFEDEINPVDYIEKSSVETKRKFLYEIFKLVVHCSFSFVCIYEQYYIERICMSANTDDERILYMSAILEVFDNNRRGQFRNSINYEFKCVMEHILYYLMKHFGEPSQKIEDKLRYIDMYHGIKIDPYGGPEILEEDVVLEPPVEEIDYMVEKHAVYDYFMRCLQILTILHTSFLRREEIYKMCKGVKCDHKKIFRSNDIESYVCSKLSDKSKCGNLPWYIEMILRKCPFVVFESPDKVIIDGLIKILKKEYVDEALEKQICKVLKLDINDDDSKMFKTGENISKKSRKKKKKICKRKKGVDVCDDDYEPSDYEPSDSDADNNDYSHYMEALLFADMDKL